jgi:hypothetical protein
MLYGFQYGCTVLYGLVSNCGSLVVWRSSQSLHDFGAYLPITWSHPTLDKYKARYPAVCIKLSSVLWPTIMKIGPPSRRFLIIWYQRLRHHGRSHIIHISTFNLPIICHGLGRVWPVGGSRPCAKRPYGRQGLSPRPSLAHLAWRWGPDLGARHASPLPVLRIVRPLELWCVLM